VCVSKREGERERERAHAREKAGEREITRAKERTESLCLLVRFRLSRSLCVCV